MLSHTTQLLELSKPLCKRYAEVEDLLSYPEIIADKPYYLKLLREKTSIQTAANLSDKLASLMAEHNSCRAALNEDICPEENKFFAQELAKLAQNITKTTSALMAELTKVTEESDIVLELVADNRHSAVFCNDLVNMYIAFAKVSGFNVIIESTTTADGGIKNATITIEGSGVYSLLQNECIKHTAIIPNGTASVSVVIYHKQQQQDIVINSKDIRMDIFNSSGAGGQNVNKVETAVRVTHLPSGIVVTCQDERSQLQNKERALLTLKDRLLERETQQYRTQVAASRKSQRMAMGKTGTRIYDFVLDTIEDCRSNTKLPISAVKNGEITMLLQSLILTEKGNQ